MPHRHKFPAHYFDTNPLAGETAHGAYRRLQWGNAPRNTFEDFEAPEEMAALGHLAAVYVVGRGKQNVRPRSFYVAVGTRSNRVYFLPMDPDGTPHNFPRGFFHKCLCYGQIRRTDYTSEKGIDRGDQAGYYYHDHESPFPTLYGSKSQHFVLVPAKLKTGGRSYAVNDEGIIG